MLTITLKIMLNSIIYIKVILIYKNECCVFGTKFKGSESNFLINFSIVWVFRHIDSLI